MAERGYSKEFKTPDMTLGFDRYLFEPEERTSDDGVKSKVYGATLIGDASTPKTAFETAAVAACVAAKWGDEAKVVEMIKNGLIKSPFLDGTGKEAHNKKTGELHPGMGPGKWFIRASTRVEGGPPIRWKSENIPATKKEVYAGCSVFAVLNAYTWDNPKNGKGVSFGLQYVQKRADGEPHYTGGAQAADPSKYFEQIEDSGSAPPETKTGAGAGGIFG